VHIKSILIDHFRNYDSVYLNFDKKLNLIVGDNAQGKTNLLESIYVSGFAKSFRTIRDGEMVNFDAQMAYVKIEVEKKDHYIETIEYRIQKNNKKTFLVNGVNITKISDLLGTLNIILFYPDDLRLIKESPVERRKFLDRELSHMSKTYCGDIIEYHHILNQRNELLKRIQFNPELSDTLEVWDEQLAEKGARVIIKRREFTAAIQPICAEIHAKITSQKENLKVKYVTSVGTGENYGTIKSELIQALSKNRESDIRRGFTAYGPHRDDLDISINGINIKSFGSQGQQRTAALSLKLSEIEIVRSEVGEYPILLLDDVMSELDINRQQDLIYALSKVQTIITTTDVAALSDDYIKNSKTIPIKDGSILNEPIGG
jgi:DNA replication and repair protein RecF